MNTKRIDFLTYFLLFIIAASASACSFGDTNAQSAAQKPDAPSVERTAEPSTPAYQSPKRVSRDIIKKEEQPAHPKNK